MVRGEECHGRGVRAGHHLARPAGGALVAEPGGRAAAVYGHLRAAGRGRAASWTAQVRRVGFKHVDWLPCEGAPAEADPWMCVVNGRPVFLQGVNFAPLCANFADLTREDYAQAAAAVPRPRAEPLPHQRRPVPGARVVLRPVRRAGADGVAGVPAVLLGPGQLAAGGRAEHRRRWRRSPRPSSSGGSTTRRCCIWCGGNEQMGDLDGSKTGMGKPCDLSHPMLKRLQRGGAGAGPHAPLHPHLALRPARQRQPGGLRQGPALGRARRRGAVARWTTPSSTGRRMTRCSAPRSTAPAPARWS